MGLFGWMTGGASGFGPSLVYQLLPFMNYRSVSTWIEEWIDAIGNEFDIRNQIFVSAQARANLLDPTYVDKNAPYDLYASATTSPNTSGIRDTMLDVLLFCAGIPWPVDSILTTAQKQAVAQIGWAALRRKGNRQQIVNLASQVCDGVVFGWTSPPYGFALVLPDGLGSGGTSPTPGWGTWISTAITPYTAGTSITFTQNSTAVTGIGTTFTKQFQAGSWISPDVGVTRYPINSVASDTALTLGINYITANLTQASYWGPAQGVGRPPLFQALRNLTQRVFPGVSALGVGYSQFRVGYSGAGEPVFASGARLNLLAHEHFDLWSAGNPTGWTSIAGNTATSSLTAGGDAGLTGSGGVYDPFVNPEFTPTAAQLAMNTQVAGALALWGPSTNPQCNNQLSHRFEMDYAYANAPGVPVLYVNIQDQLGGAVPYYWNPTTKKWTSTVYNIPVPPCTPVTLTGSLTFTASSQTVTGIGTLFTSQLQVGQRISYDKSTWSIISAIASDTSLTLRTASGVTQNNVTGYALTRQRFGFDVVPQQRSVGMLLAGTVTLTAGSTSVTGSGTAFTSQLVVGQLISVDQGRWYTVSAIVSDTSLTLSLKAVATAAGVVAWSSFYAATPRLYVNFGVRSDGTATTQQNYQFYRFGLYEKWNLAVDQAALGERSAWFPLVDSAGWTNATGGGTIEPANADRSSYRVVSSGAEYPYHPAISGRGFRAATAWTNLIKGSNDFGADWTLTNLSRTAANQISPAIGETTATAPLFTPSGAGTCKIAQASVIANPAGLSYVGGVWLRTVAGAPSSVQLILSSSGHGSYSTSITLTSNWQLFPLPPTTMASTDTGALSLTIQYTASGAGDTISAAQSYLYDVTGNTGVLYPPVVQTSVGSTATSTATTCNATTASQSVNVLHPLLQRTLCSVVRGAVAMTVVPTFDGTSQPVNGTLFDVSQNTTHNRVVLQLLNAISTYSTHGSATFTNGSATVTGAGSSFIKDFEVNQLISADNVTFYTITAIASDTSLTVSSTFAASTTTVSTYYGSAVALKMLYYDNSATLFAITLQLSNLTTPPLSVNGRPRAAWLRDTPISVIARWDSGAISLSVGNASAITIITGAWAPTDTPVSNLTIGNQNGGAGAFNGIIKNVEILQVGAPAS